MSGPGQGASATRLQTVAVWAEIAAAISVVLSLVFVGLQIRQSTAETMLNTRIAQAAAYQDLQSQLALVTTVQIENADLRRAMARVRGGDRLEMPGDADDLHVYTAYARLVIRLGDLAFYQRQTGLIDDARLASMLSPLRVDVLSNPLGRSIWEAMSGSLVPGFIEHVDSALLATLPPIER